MVKKLLTISLIFITVFTTGCVCMLPAYGSRPYQPVSDWEKRESDKADRHIYPDDIRSNINKYQSMTIVWAGIIKDAKVSQTAKGFDIKYLLEHHYYDWIEDINPQQQKVWLSPRGEGIFTTEWSVTKETTQTELDGMTRLNDLLIVYGTPQAIMDSTVIIAASYIRGIPQRYYTMGKLDYGRQ